MGAWAMLAMLLAGGSGWKALDSVDGIEVFAREVPNERLYELKLVTWSSLSIAQLCDAAFGNAVVDPEERPISSIALRRLIRQTETPDGVERILYEQVTPP